MEKLGRILDRMEDDCPYSHWIEHKERAAEIRGLLSAPQTQENVQRAKAGLVEMIKALEAQARDALETNEKELARVEALVQAQPLEPINRALAQNREAFLKEVEELTACCLAERERLFEKEYNSLLEQLCKGLEEPDSEKALDKWLLEEAPKLLPPASQRLQVLFSNIPDEFLERIRPAYERYVLQQAAQLDRIDEIFFGYAKHAGTCDPNNFPIPCASSSGGLVWTELGLLLAPWIGGELHGVFRKKRRIPYLPMLDLPGNKRFLRLEWQERLSKIHEAMCKSAKEAGDRQLFQIQLKAKERSDLIRGYGQNHMNDSIQTGDKCKRVIRAETKLLSTLAQLEQECNE